MEQIDKNFLMKIMKIFFFWKNGWIHYIYYKFEWKEISLFFSKLVFSWENNNNITVCCQFWIELSCSCRLGLNKKKKKILIRSRLWSSNSNSNATVIHLPQLILHMELCFLRPLPPFFWEKSCKPKLSSQNVLTL